MSSDWLEIGQFCDFSLDEGVASKGSLTANQTVKQWSSSVNFIQTTEVARLAPWTLGERTCRIHHVARGSAGIHRAGLKQKGRPIAPSYECASLLDAASCEG